MSRVNWLESGKFVITYGHLWYYLIMPIGLILAFSGILFGTTFRPLLQLFYEFKTSTKIDFNILMQIKDIAIQSMFIFLPYILISFLLIFISLISLIRAIYAVYLHRKIILLQNFKRTMRDIIPGLVLLVLLIAILYSSVLIAYAVIGYSIWWLSLITVVLLVFLNISCSLFSFHYYIIKRYNVIKAITASIKLIPLNFTHIFQTFMYIVLTLSVWLCLFGNIYFFGKYIDISLAFFWGVFMVLILVPIMLLIMVYLSLTFFSLEKL